MRRIPEHRNGKAGGRAPSGSGGPSAALLERSRVALIVSRYNTPITDRLEEGALRAFRGRVRGGSIEVFDAPGSYELPFLAQTAAGQGRFDGVVTLGCIIKGQTRHDEYIAHAVAQGLVVASLGTGVPCAFGVLTVDTPGQASDRAGGKHGNKGEEAMNALLDTIQTVRSMSGARGPAPKRAGRGR